MQNETRVSENLFSVQDDKKKGTPVHLPRLKVQNTRKNGTYVFLY